MSLSVVAYGAGQPKRVVVTGLHGGEESGVALLSRLVAQLPDSFSGSLVLVPSASPLTQAFKTRNSPIDGSNPNRMFPGKKTGTLSERTAAALTIVIQGADTVIDLHCFSQDCLFTGLDVNTGAPDIQQQSRRLINSLGPDIIWKLDGTEVDGSKSTVALDGYARSIGIASCTVEMPRADHLSNVLLDRIVAGLNAALFSPAVAEPSIPVITRRDIRAERSGYFNPLVRPGQPVAVGAVIGSLTDIATLATRPVKSALAGTLFLITRPGIVRTGDKLYSIGQPV